MEDIVGVIFSGVARVVGKLFSHPLDFLAGKSCDRLCMPTWDLMCYIQNFCVAHLVKFAMVFLLCYFVLLFFFLLHKLGICHCIFHTISGIIRACFSACFHLSHCCCTCLCYKLRKHNQRRRREREIGVTEMVFSGADDCEGSFSCHRTRLDERGRSRLMNVGDQG